MSKKQFPRLFKRATGTTPHSWRLREKVRGSRRDLLKQNRWQRTPFAR
ncbi:hypothetical protein [Paraburkholderia hospita]|nr:hypothetical protein [Paraburkholderia hospita]